MPVAEDARLIVLLVDDDPGLRESILREMAAQGYEPMHAPTVTLALGELRTSQCASLFVIDAADGSVPTVRVAALVPRREACDPFAVAMDRAAALDTAAGIQGGRPAVSASAQDGKIVTGARGRPR